jgi:hypothetical protein
MHDSTANSSVPDIAMTTTNSYTTNGSSRKFAPMPVVTTSEAPVTIVIYSPVKVLAMNIKPHKNPLIRLEIHLVNCQYTTTATTMKMMKCDKCLADSHPEMLIICSHSCYQAYLEGRAESDPSVNCYNCDCTLNPIL